MIIIERKMQANIHTKTEQIVVGVGAREREIE
jgi:hypothetical protein